MAIRRADGVSYEPSGDSVVILDADGVVMTTLNELGTVIWNELGDETELASIVEQLGRRFPDIGEAELTTDVSDVDDLPFCTNGNTQNCDPGERGGLATTIYTQDEWQVFERIDNAQCALVNIEHGCVRGPDPAARIIKSGVLDANQQIAAFQQNVRVGSCGSGQEQGLKAMQLALGRRLQAGGCNEGLIRPEANLVVID